MRINPRKITWPLILAIAAGLATAEGALVGTTMEISGPGCRFPDVAYGSVSRKHLVVWVDYNVGGVFGRLVDGDGGMAAGAFTISEAGFGALYPAVAFNAATNEFLVTWDDAGSRGGVIFGQRVRGADGALAGNNFAIGSIFGGIRSAVASSPHGYLVVYWGPGSPDIEIYGQRVSPAGALLGGNFNVSLDDTFSGYPAIGYAPSTDQFLVTWDNDDGNIHGRRVAAASGALAGTPIIITSGGAKDRSCVTFDPGNNRWLVQFNDGANPGYSYDQFGRLVSTDGSLQGGLIPLAHTAAFFEGDTQFGGDVAFDPVARRYFSSFGTDSGMGGQESLASGAPVGTQVTLGTGFYTSLNNAADTHTHRFLTAWEGRPSNSNNFHVFGQFYAATLAPAANFSADSHDSRNELAWQNPADLHFSGTMIRYKTTGYPSSPSDGILVADVPGLPQAAGAFSHSGLENWTTYYYTVFAHDDGPNYALAAQAAATPRPAVVVIDESDFGTDANGWALAAWRAGTLQAGTIQRDPAAQNIVSTGSGATNNQDACTREGTLLTKAVSTAGRQSIQVEYDVMVALDRPPGGAPTGSCAALESSSEDKLVVYYSINGTNGPWTAVQILSELAEFPTAWTRKIINLSGVPGVGDNPNFALRFQWQFNSAADAGRLDNIRALSGAVTALSPVIGLHPLSFERTVPAGGVLPDDFLKVSNTGEGPLTFSVGRNLPWIGLSPAGGTTSGPERRIVISYHTGELAVGDHEAMIQISAMGVESRTVPVRLHLVPPACFWEPFSYYDGNLNIMGALRWNGTASNQITVRNGALEMAGGTGEVTANQPLSCAGANGIIAAQIKIKEGPGSGDFFWSIYVDDNSGNAGTGNFGRWYGGSNIARGRIGGSITPDMVLSGPNSWDDLFMKIDTGANTTEFFFNGQSFGTLSHGAAATNTAGAIRLVRLDRTSAASDSIQFDNLTVGAPDASPRRFLLERDGSQWRLKWPATGSGATVESSLDLATWSASTGAPAVVNGEAVFSVVPEPESRFFRLRRR